ncbi:S8/S53 family peptidase [Candidatus Roizmanbacteria bacterium]|nr:MAG: S8/S53 family peptidase [Candidatus Roizmanbacteria bacterium]
MNKEKKSSFLGIATTGAALIALSYFAKPGVERSYSTAVQYDPVGIVIPFGDDTFSKRMNGLLTYSEDQELTCGSYPDDTNDPYLQEQKSLVQEATFDENGTTAECADQYVGYDYIAHRLEEHIPQEERRPVTLVIMDSGINAEHEDWCDGQIDKELSKTFLDSVHNETSPLTDEIGHGTAVAGIAAACTGNGVGIASLGRGVNIASIKVMFPYGGDGIVNPSDWKEALAYVDKTARTDTGRQFVLNMSFSGFSYNQEMADIFEALPENITVIAGAGNNPYNMPTNSLDYPAGYDRVYAVGAAVDEASDTLCAFSHYSTAKERFVAAPGCFDLWGLNNMNDGNFPYRDGLSGTSFSTPNAAGMYSYFLHIFPVLSPADIMQTIYDTSLPVGQASQGTIDKPVPAIAPLQAIRALTVKAGYADILVPSEENRSFLPYLSR